MRCDMEMRSTTNNSFSVSSIQKGWGQCSLQEAEKPWECFLPLSGHFLCSLCIKAVTGCFSHADCLRHGKTEGGERNATSNSVNVNSIHLFLVYLCQRVRHGQWIKNPAHLKTNPVVSVVAVESGHELGINQSFSQPFALLLSESSVFTNKSWIWHLFMKGILSKQHTAKEMRRVPCFTDINRLWEVSTAKHSC